MWCVDRACSAPAQVPRHHEGRVVATEIEESEVSSSFLQVDGKVHVAENCGVDAVRVWTLFTCPGER